MNSWSSACPRCETPVSTGGGRCPTCGFEIPATPSAAPPNAAAGGPRPLLRRPTKPKGSPAAIAITAALALAAGGLFLWRIRMDTAAEASAPSQSAPPAQASETPTPRLLDSTAVFNDAKKRALGWNGEALLIAIDAHTVVDGGQLDVEHGGTLEIVFGKPVGAKLVAGERVDRERFVVHADASGTQTRTDVAKAGGIAAGDPNCMLDQVWSKGVAAGLPSTRALDAHYAWDAKRARSVWAESASDDASMRRTLDGWTCAVVVR